MAWKNKKDTRYKYWLTGLLADWHTVLAMQHEQMIQLGQFEYEDETFV